MSTELIKGIGATLVTIETLWLEWSTERHPLIIYWPGKDGKYNISPQKCQ